MAVSQQALLSASKHYCHFLLLMTYCIYDDDGFLTLMMKSGISRHDVVHCCFVHVSNAFQCIEPQFPNLNSGNKFVKWHNWHNLVFNMHDAFPEQQSYFITLKCNGTSSTTTALNISSPLTMNHCCSSRIIPIKLFII